MSRKGSNHFVSRARLYQPDSVDPPRLERVETGAGEHVSALVYEPEGAVLGNVLIHSATACPQRFYADFARELASAGLRVISYDYRGVGLSRPADLRACTVTLADWALVDARAMHQHVQEHYPEEPLGLVGHSFGAQLLGLVDEAAAADAAVFVGGQFGYFGHWPQPQAAALRALWQVVVPTLTATFGYLPSQAGLGEDLPRGVARQWARWCSSPDYLMSEFPDARDRYARFDKPVLAYSFTDDSFAPKPAVNALHRALCTASINHQRILPGAIGANAVGHFGYFRRRIGSELWKDTTRFLLEQLSASAEARAAEAPPPLVTSLSA
jgi:predicted alpha/beta hydrolase